RLDLAGELVAAADGFEVERDRRRRDAVRLGEPLRLGLQSRGGACRENEIVAVLREALGQGEADPRARAGDERRLSFTACRVGHCVPPDSARPPPRADGSIVAVARRVQPLRAGAANGEAESSFRRTPNRWRSPSRSHGRTRVARVTRGASGYLRW